MNRDQKHLAWMILGGLGAALLGLLGNVPGLIACGGLSLGFGLIGLMLVLPVMGWRHVFTIQKGEGK